MEVIVLANMNSRSRSLYAIARLSVPYTHPVEIFGNVSTPFGTWPRINIHGKFYEYRSRRTPPSGDYYYFVVYIL